jgi:hypothetical protein
MNLLLNNINIILKNSLLNSILAFKLTHNVLQLPEGGDFGALYCQPSRNFDRSTRLDLTTEPTLLGRCCYGLVLFYNSKYSQSPDQAFFL